MKTYIGTVPNNVILVTVTPPDNTLGYDEFETIPKHLMHRLMENGLPYLLNSTLFKNDKTSSPIISMFS